MSIQKLMINMALEYTDFKENRKEVAGLSPLKVN